MRYLLRNDALRFSRASGLAWSLFAVSFGLLQTPRDLFGLSGPLLVALEGIAGRSRRC